MVTLAPTQPDQTRDGYSYAEACRILAAEGAQVVGLNCDRGPQTMLPLMARIREKVDCAVAAQPVPYRTDAAAPTMQALRIRDRAAGLPLALEPFGCTRFEMAQFALQARDLGVDYVGICCGAGPHHVRAMAEALGREVPASKYSPSMDLHPMFRARCLNERRHVPQLLGRMRVSGGPWPPPRPTGIFLRPRLPSPSQDRLWGADTGA